MKTRKVHKLKSKNRTSKGGTAPNKGARIDLTRSWSNWAKNDPLGQDTVKYASNKAKYLASTVAYGSKATAAALGVTNAAKGLKYLSNKSGATKYATDALARAKEKGVTGLARNAGNVTLKGLERGKNLAGKASTAASRYGTLIGSRLSKAGESTTFMSDTVNPRFKNISKQCYEFSKGCEAFSKSPSLGSVKTLMDQANFIMDYSNKSVKQFYAIAKSTPTETQDALRFLFKWALLSDHLKKHMDSTAPGIVSSELYQEVLFFAAVDMFKKEPPPDELDLTEFDKDLQVEAKAFAGIKAQAGGEGPDASPTVIQASTVTTTTTPSLPLLQAEVLPDATGKKGETGSGGPAARLEGETVTGGPAARLEGETVTESVVKTKTAEEAAAAKAEEAAKAAAALEARKAKLKEEGKTTEEIEKIIKGESVEAGGPEAGGPKDEPNKKKPTLWNMGKQAFSIAWDASKGKFNPEKINKLMGDVLKSGYIPEEYTDMFKDAMENGTLDKEFMKQFMGISDNEGKKIALEEAIKKIESSVANEQKEIQQNEPNESTLSRSGQSGKNAILEAYGAAIYEKYKKNELYDLEQNFNDLYTKQFINGPYKGLKAYKEKPNMSEDDFKKLYPNAETTSKPSTEPVTTSENEYQKIAPGIVDEIKSKGFAIFKKYRVTQKNGAYQIELVT